jgi:hypothetical protein
MFCNKCGNELSANAVFCNMCGAQVSAEKKATYDVPEMTVEESIVFIEKLKHKYQEVEKLQREISDKESAIARPVYQELRRYSFFRFFWKYIIFAIIAFYGILILSSVAAGNDGAFTVMLILTFLVPIGLLIFGGINAAKRCNEENEAIINGNERAVLQRKELEEKTASLKRDLATRKKRLEADEYMIPTGLRKSSSLAQIITLLKSGKASSLNEAYTILGK